MENALKRAVAITLGLCLLIGVTQASAWEFSLKGDWNWEYKLYAQTGHNGFFGKYNVANVPMSGYTVGDGANANGWLGNEILWDQVVSGTDAAASTMYMYLYPEFRINQAVRVRGSYRIGSWYAYPASDPYRSGGWAFGQFNAPEYFTNTIPGSKSSFSPGYWNTLWCTAQTPWGIVALGKRPFSFGSGLILDGADNTTYEGLLVVVPYGPFRIGAAWMPWTSSANQNYYYYGYGYNGTYAMADKNAVQDVRLGGFVTYDSGALSIGAITEYMRWHSGPESKFFQNQRLSYVPNDSTLQYGTAYAKFNNGRFFFNVEAAFINSDTHRQSSSTPPNLANVGVLGGTIHPIAPTYIQHGRFMTEFGCYSGPAKLSLLWAYIQGGEDRRYGIYMDRQSDTRSLRQFSNYSLFRPYSILLAWNYGSGNGSYTSSPFGTPDGTGSDNGYITDANTYGGRLDYAVAANLNVYGSFFYAERLSKGYGWGYMAPWDTSSFASLYYASVPGKVGYQNKTTTSAQSRAIPDNALGYEIDAGFDWKLLEGYTVSVAMGYWVPGKWFNYACVDRAISNWANQSVAINFAANPNRTIDPVFGLDILLKAEF